VPVYGFAFLCDTAIVPHGTAIMVLEYAMSVFRELDSNSEYSAQGMRDMPPCGLIALCVSTAVPRGTDIMASQYNTQFNTALQCWDSFENLTGTVKLWKRMAKVALECY
jgi:hypothetical protein